MKLQTLKGTKDYLPKEQIIRNRITDVLRQVFENYGYKPVETSIIDFWEIGASKYAGGEEILKETYKLCDQAKRKLMLRYELTFKLAKLIGLNPTTRMPFKRYEIGKVFRDGPVKTGRLREFTQCDIDAIGLKTRAVDAEIVAIGFDVLRKLGLDANVKINSRPLLFGMFKESGIPEKKFINAATALDKLTKTGEAQVREEMESQNIDKKSVAALFNLLKKTKNKNTEQLIKFIEKKVKNEYTTKGITEIKEFFKYMKLYKLNKIYFVPTLSRGLSYYTGMYWEFYVDNNIVKSSIAAGGRWDNMINQFIGCKRQYPATGMSFGLDTLFSAVSFDSTETPGVALPRVYVIPVTSEQMCYAITVAYKLRKKGISTDLAYEKKLTKAIDYARKENIEACIILGETEMKLKKVKLKDMKTGKEKIITVENASKLLQSKSLHNKKS